MKYIAYPAAYFKSIQYIYLHVLYMGVAHWSCLFIKLSTALVTEQQNISYKL